MNSTKDANLVPGEFEKDAEDSITRRIIASLFNWFLTKMEVILLISFLALATSTAPDSIDCSYGDYHIIKDDCHSYWQCYNGKNPIKMTCGDLMFHPDFEICDWPENVISARPQCALAYETSKIPKIIKYFHISEFLLYRTN